LIEAGAERESWAVAADGSAQHPGQEEVVRVSVNPEYCERSGECIAQVPCVFYADAAGRTRTIDGEVPPELEDEVRAAADFCPRLALSITP